MTAKRAIRDFRAAGDPWTHVSQWAGHQGYHMVQQDDGHRVYKKGHGLLVGARKVEVSARGGEIHVEAYVTANLGARISSLFIMPREITVESGGGIGAVPRKMGRTEVNELLREFSQEPIT